MSHPAPAIESPPTSLLGGVVTALSDIKLAHSVFALPFALAASFVVGVGPDGSVTWGRFATLLGLVVVCMVCARTWAMLINRLADRRFDADNPRTAGRALAAGRVSVPHAWLAATVSAALFLVSCALFWLIDDNVWPLALGVPVLAWIALYSYTKRFTAWCHVFLGGALAVSPLAAAIAVGGMEGLLAHWQPLAGLSGFVLLWVAGFDIAYALQDLAFDRARGLRSVPAAVGWRGALWIARAMHTLALGALIAVPISDDRLSTTTWVGVGLTAALLAWEHRVLHTRGLAGLPMAFFTINGVVSVLLGTLVILDALM
ncbi:MAG: putative 4-hydroxybenzoate polyprenyltransferase [Phycisphaerales bacterium]